MSGIPLTRSILRIMTNTASPICSAAGILCSTEPALKKYPLRNGDSNSNSKGSGWPQRMTISITGAAQLPFTRIPARARHVGNELDIVAEYTLNKGFNLGFGYCRMFAGPFLRTTTAGHDYQYPYAYIEYNFTKSGFHFPITINQPNYW